MESDLEISEAEACEGVSAHYFSQDDGVNSTQVDEAPPGLLPYRSQIDYADRIDQEPREVYIVPTNNGYRAVRVDVTSDLTTHLGEKVFVLTGQINDAEYKPRLKLIQLIKSKIDHSEIFCCYEKLKNFCYYFFKLSSKKTEGPRTRSSTKHE